MTVRRDRIDNFVCPACGEVIRQVSAVDGVVKGWCPTAKKKINVVVDSIEEETINPPDIIDTTPLSYLDELKQKRAKVLKELISAEEDGDLKENSGFHAAREELTILDYRIATEKRKG